MLGQSRIIESRGKKITPVKKYDTVKKPSHRSKINTFGC